MARIWVKFTCICLVGLMVAYFFNGSRVLQPIVTNQWPVVTSYGSKPFCQVQCRTGVPCRYPTEVALRVLVLAMNRASSLQKCLDHIRDMDTLGDSVSVHIWIDRSASGKVDQPTLDVALAFIQREGRRFSRRACVHVQNEHAYIMGQWINVWRPEVWREREMALILEDDVDVSAHAYRWLKSVRRQYGHRQDIAGYTLRMADWSAFGDDKMVPFRGPTNDVVFAYPMASTWGLSPHPVHWRRFQDWFHRMYPQRNATGFRPLVPGLFQNRWYVKFAKRGDGFEDSFWEMWYHHFCHQHGLFTIFCNLDRCLRRKDVLLVINRREAGLHFDRNAKKLGPSYKLMVKWHEKYAKFPAKLKKYNYNNSLVVD